MAIRCQQKVFSISSNLLPSSIKRRSKFCPFEVFNLAAVHEVLFMQTTFSLRSNKCWCRVSCCADNNKQSELTAEVKMHRFSAVNCCRAKQWGAKQGWARHQNHRNQPPTKNHRCYKNLKGSPHRYEQPAGRATDADNNTPATARRWCLHSQKVHKYKNRHTLNKR